MTKTDAMEYIAKIRLGTSVGVLGFPKEQGCWVPVYLDNQLICHFQDYRIGFPGEKKPRKRNCTTYIPELIRQELEAFLNEP